MSGSSFGDIQEAIYNTLRNDPGIKALVGNPARVYDYTPDNETFPYITIGQMIGGPNSTWSSYGQVVIATFHVWSRYLGYKETDQICNAIGALFGDQDVDVDNWWDSGCWYDSGETLDETDENGTVTRHAIERYRFKVVQL